jgi:hypothetical protein
MIIFTICTFGHSITRGQDVQVDHGGQVAILPTPVEKSANGPFPSALRDPLWEGEGYDYFRSNERCRS